VIAIYAEAAAGDAAVAAGTAAAAAVAAVAARLRRRFPPRRRPDALGLAGPEIDGLGLAGAGWADAALPVLSEEAMAAREREQGREVVAHGGRWWLQTAPGFYQPVCLMTPLRAEQATRPTALCWGFRAALAPEDAGRADAALTVHTLPDLGRYGPASLAPGQRRRVAKALREFDVVALDSPDLLLEQGYALVAEAHARNPGVPMPSRPRFERWAASYFAPRRGLVLAALRHGRLLAFNTQSAVEGVVYGETAYAGAEGRRHGLCACLFHAAATIASRTPGVHTLVDGQHARENQGLCDFKRSLGLELARVPALVWLAPVAGPLLRRVRPHAHYRLTGRG
jgi:hypothetical protein